MNGHNAEIPATFNMRPTSVIFLPPSISKNTKKIADITNPVTYIPKRKFIIVFMFLLYGLQIEKKKRGTTPFPNQTNNIF